MGRFDIELMDFTDESTPPKMAEIWRRGMPVDFFAEEGFFRYNIRPCRHGAQAGWWAVENGHRIGFALASLIRDDEKASPPDIGWLDALVVDGAFQRRGAGRALAAQAESWLAGQGCTVVVVGQSIRTFFAGLPYALDSLGFFQKLGYQDREHLCWDMARDLGDGLPISRHPAPVEGAVRPCEAQDIPALMEFLWRDFPGRWRYEIEDFLANGGRTRDIMILKLGERVEGFCLLTLPDSIRPVDRYYPRRLPQPWGQLGTIGVSQAVRGQGWGGQVLQTGLEFLRARGIRGCVIDWTSLLEFYGKYGFEPYTRYRVLTRLISA